LAIILAPETLEDRSRASKDSHYSLEFKQTLSHNIGSSSGRWHH